jgi:hypothetical protein
MPRESENPENALKYCAKTAAQINVQSIAYLDELRRFRGAYLEGPFWGRRNTWDPYQLATIPFPVCAAGGPVAKKRLSQ